ncbi:MAG: YqgE/AlgH family protein [Chthoniobacterales bacterium]|nr:YqgE/AlgH family protein [Chthoniobacterales bacterium]
MSNSAENIQLPENMSGYVLAASPVLLDPNFRKTVVYLHHHSRKEGALGFVLNRPLPVCLGEISTAKLDSHIAQTRFFYGGPVTPEQIIILGIRVKPDSETYEFRFFDNKIEIEDIPEDWSPHLRLFVGHSGWAPGQLENEIQHNSWIVLPQLLAAFNPQEPENAWQKLLSIFGPKMQLISNCPDDTSKN